MEKTAILLGATGLTGELLLQKLLKDSRYEKVKLFSRTSVGITDPKIDEHLIDLFKLDEYAKAFVADEVFCCIGSTKKKTPNDSIYRKVDFGIPVSAAKLAKQNKIDTFIVISALGADSKSKLFYSRTKGEMENAVSDFKIPNTYLLQPSLITGVRREKRILESLGKLVMKIINPLLIGDRKKFRSIDAHDIATAMIYLANNPISEKRIKSDRIAELSTLERSN